MSSETEKKGALPRLGKGLEALIPRVSISSGKTISSIPIEDIRPNTYQPRVRFDEEAIAELAESIKQYGVVQPIVIRKADEGYELIAGERRYRASMAAGLTSIPAVIRDLSDEESLKIALIENIQRKDLNPIEVANGYLQLIEEFGLTHQELSATFSRARSTVTNTLRLLNLPLKLQNAVIIGEITEGHARALLALDTEEAMFEYYERIKRSGLNVREVEYDIQDSGKSTQKKGAEKKASGQLPLFADLETEIGRVNDITVKIKGSSQKGRITLSYDSPEKLEELCAKLGQANIELS